MMNALLEYVLEAHGGLQTWQRMRTFSADLSIGGLLWDMKCRSVELANVRMSTSLRDQNMTIEFPVTKRRIYFSS